MAEYQKYVDSGISWIGDIPAHWRVVRLQTQLEEVNDKNNPVRTRKILSLTNKLGVIPYEEKGNQGNKAKEDLTGYKLAYPNCIVANSMNILIGSVGLSKYFGCVSPVYYVFRGKDSSNIEYMNYLFSTSSFQKELRKYANGILEIRLRVSSGNILKRKIALPPSEEQSQIVSFLNTQCAVIDELINEATASIEDLRAYEYSLISERITTENAQIMSLRHCIQNIEQGWSPPPAEALDTDTGWYVLALSAVKKGKFISDSRKPIDANAVIPENLVIRKGDFLMTRSNTRELVGDVCIVDDDIKRTIFSDLIYRISFNERLSPQYAKHLLRSAFVRQQIQSAAQGTSGSMPKISHKVIKTLKVPIPTLDKQEAITGYLDSVVERINALIKEKEALISDLEAYKESLIFEVVTGKRKA